MSDTENIHSKLAAIIGELPAIGKESKVTGNFGYNYRGIEDILPAVKGLFAKHSVHVAPDHTLVSDEAGLGHKGNQRRVVLHSGFTFYAADGSSFTCHTMGEAMDTQDKALNKAMTAAYKYALIQTLAIADGDDPDAYQPGEAATESQPARATEPQPEPSESWRKLVALGPELKKAGIDGQVKDWAKSNDVNLADKTADVTAVVKFAENLMSMTDLDEVPAQGEIVDG